MKTIFDLIEEIKTKALEGEINELEAFIKLSEIEKFAKIAKEEVSEAAITEIRKFDSKTVKEYGYEITASSGGRYNYKHIPEWLDLSNKLKAIEKKAQQGYIMTKATGATDNLIDVVTGELLPVAEYLPSKMSIKLKKC